MSEIILNNDNVSRFNKRLQKALEKHFGSEVKLHEAAKIFAQAIGKNSEYELKKVLEYSQDEPSNFEDKIKKFDNNKEYLDTLLYRIQELLKNTTAKFVYIDFMEDEDSICPASFSVGFQDFNIEQKNDLLENCIDSSNLNLQDFINGSEFINVNNKDQIQTQLEARKEINKDYLPALFKFQEDYIYEIAYLVSDCDDFIIVEKDKITLSLRNNSHILANKQFKKKI